MKIKSMFHASILFMAVLILNIPVASFAQDHNSTQQQAIADVKRDAEACVSFRVVGRGWSFGWLSGSTRS